MTNYKTSWLVFFICLLFAGCCGSGTTAIEYVHLVPMTSETIVRSQTVLIKGDRIVAIGTPGSITLPGGCTIIDGQGADLVMVKGNPLENISSMKSIQGVRAAGTWYDKSKLNEMAALKGK